MKSRTTVDGPVKSLILILIAGLLNFLSGCFDLEAHNRRAREEQEAKARAEAARKEMEILPKAFQTPDYFRVNQPAQKGDTQPPAGKTDR
jgi:hypothetical protein